MKAGILLAGAALLAMPLACAAEIPLHTSHYNNPKYQFSIDIPDHLQGCITDDTEDGVEIPLARHSSCEHVTDRPSYATVYGSYNVATGAKSAKGLARLYCRSPEVKRMTWLNDSTLGGRMAAGCQLYYDGDKIEIKLMTLLRTDPRNPEVWIEVGAYLSTTAPRAARDMREFHKIVDAIRIAPDGPHC